VQDIELRFAVSVTEKREIIVRPKQSVSKIELWHTDQNFVL
jgi:hypothetical protein